MRKRLITSAAVGAIALPLAAWASGAVEYQLSYSIDAGGGTSSGGGLVLTGVVGQPDAGVLTRGNLQLIGGFGPSTRCLEDIDGNGAVDVDDLVAVLLAWDAAGDDVEADVNRDGVVNVDDLLAVILSWGLCG